MPPELFSEYVLTVAIHVLSQKPETNETRDCKTFRSFQVFIKVSVLDIIGMSVFQIGTPLGANVGLSEY